MHGFGALWPVQASCWLRKSSWVLACSAAADLLLCVRIRRRRRRCRRCLCRPSIVPPLHRLKCTPLSFWCTGTPRDARLQASGSCSTRRLRNGSMARRLSSLQCAGCPVLLLLLLAAAPATAQVNGVVMYHRVAGRRVIDW